MSDSIVAHRYAKALFNQSNEQNVLDDNNQHIQEIARLLSDVPEFGHFVHNPVIPVLEQEKIIQALFEHKVSPLLFQFLKFLIYKGRLDLLKEIALEFEELYFNSKRQTRVVVESAEELDGDIKEQILAKLNTITGFSLVPTWNIVPSMIGGVRVYVQGKLYEYSFKNELRDYKRRALERI